MFIVPGLVQTIRVFENIEDDWNDVEPDTVGTLLDKARIFNTTSGTSHINNYVDYNQSSAYVIIQAPEFKFKKGQYIQDFRNEKWVLIETQIQTDPWTYNYLYTKLSLRRIA